MLTITELVDAEYVISSVALALDEYYAGIGEAPGVWSGRFAPLLGLEGRVEPDDLRALVAGHHPGTGEDLLAGRRRRTVHVFDLTVSAPKGVSVLWGLGSPEVAEVVARAHGEAVEVAMGFLEDKAALARQQVRRVRRQVPTAGFAVAGYFHRTSRAGDPQLHSHCLVANLVQRADGSHVAFDADALFDWAKAAGTLYHAELQRLLSKDLGLAWGPDRNGTREPVGLAPEVLRAFSKRAEAIEAELEAQGAVYESPAARMAADDDASLATRPDKNHSLTPALLAGRWAEEAAELGLDGPKAVEAALLGRAVPSPAPSAEAVVAALVDPHSGLCANSARFREAHVVEAVAALSAGRLTTAEIVAHAEGFVASEHVVRLVPGEGRRRPAEWSTVAHRRLEDAVLAGLAALAERPLAGLEEAVVADAVAAEGQLGQDQEAAVAALCGPGSGLRALVAPAGFGKTTAVHAAAAAWAGAGHDVLGVATTNQAVTGLASVGLAATTIARLRLDLQRRPLAPGSVVVLDEVSQVSTADAAVVVGAVAATPGAQLWCLGDPRQAPAVGAAGLGAEVARLAAAGAIVAPVLRTNRRQRHRADRRALGELRAGRAAASQAIRAEWGWEHEEPTPAATRQAMAEAVLADLSRHGPPAVAVLAVSHADCEDLADRIRARLAADGALGGPTLAGPAWGDGPDRRYGAGDRVLLHTKSGHAGLHNGSTGTVVAVEDDGLRVAFDDRREVVLVGAFVAGRRGDGRPNLSHAWARTVEGAQGGTWEAVHLLGSASLDGLVGYSGQSRGRAPTHTWNTRPLVAAEVGGMAADRRSATEAVLAGLQRQPDTTFAATGDPFLLDRRLRAERDEHLSVLARTPPHRTAELQRARRVADHDVDVLARAAAGLRRAQERVASSGPLSSLRRAGRQERSAAEDALSRARHELARARHQRQATQQQVAALAEGEQRRQRFEAEQGWRVERVSALERQLDRHWAAATLAAVRQDDPLAFGTGRLRAARAIAAADLAAYQRRLPSDRSVAIAEAQRALADAEVDLRAARHERDSRRALHAAGERRWGRRDRQAVVRAAALAERAEEAAGAAARAVGDARAHLAAQLERQRERARAWESTGAERARLTAALGTLDAALDDTLAQRVAELSERAVVPAHLAGVLGEPPDDPAARRAWCGLVSRIESYRDRHPEALDHESQPGLMAAIGPRPAQRWLPAPEWDELAGQLRNGAELLMAAAEVDAGGVDPGAKALSWACILDRAGTNRAVDHDLGLGR